MSTGTSITQIKDPRLVKALAHPLRIQILGALEDRTASPSELHAELDAPLGNVSYHVRQLHGLGLLKLVRRRQRRGAVEHYYTTSGKIAVSADAWDGIPAIVKGGIAAAGFREVAQLVGASKPSDLTRVDIRRARVTERTARAVNAELARAYDRIGKLLASADAGDTPLSVVLLAVEDAE